MKFRIIAVSAFAAVLTSSAFGATFTQTVLIPTANTDVVNGAALFNLFGSVGAPGGSTLTGVTLDITIAESLNSLTLTNNSTTTQSASYRAQANFDASDTANSGDGTELDNALANNLSNSPATIYFTGTLNFTANQQYTSSAFPLPKILTETTGSIAGTTSAYVGSGTFDLDYSTLSGYTVSGGGNNVNNSQATTASATATVIYTYSTPSSTPEPTTTVLIGSGLMALSFLGRKRLLRRS